jgi:hypothetical protein
MGININQLTNLPVVLERTPGITVCNPRALPLTLDFAASLEYTIDYSNMQARGFFSMVQTVWVDNMASATILYITIPAVNQVLQIPANTQGYFPVLCPNPVNISFASAGGVAVQVILLNFPV